MTFSLPSRSSLLKGSFLNHGGNSSKGPYPTSEKENDNRCLVFVSSIKHQIGKFHVVTVQWQQRDVPKVRYNFCFYILYTFSILLQNGEEIGMKKDRLFLFDETVVPASLTQLREVTSTIKTQIVLFQCKNFTFALVNNIYSVSTWFLPSPLRFYILSFCRSISLGHQEIMCETG